MNKTLEQTGSHNGAIQVHIGDEQIQFVYGGNQHILPFGDKSIAQKYFKPMPPTDAEIEYAIQEIEDELMTVAATITAQNLQPVSSDERIREIAGYAGKQGEMSTADVEGVFSRFALIVRGRPASTDVLPLDSNFAAYLLILREVMHHLKFSRLKVIK